MNKPLSDVRILDLTHMLSGPYGGMILADLGAETIKVEPLAGEGTRKLLATDPVNSVEGMGAYFLTLNRNKKSIAIDLKDPDGLKLFYQLVEQSDIVLSNFGPGVPERLKIDFDTLKQYNPKIITCAISGFGSDGPSHKRPAFDQVAQAIGGGMSITGYVALADPTKLNASTLAFIQVSLTNTSTKNLRDFNSRIRAMSEVEACHMVAGGFDYLLKIRCSDMQHYQQFLGEHLAAIPLVAQTHTYVVIEEVKNETAIDLNYL